MRTWATLTFLALAWAGPALAADGQPVAAAAAKDQPACALTDRACIIGHMEATAAQIENNAWRDQTYREIAKTLAFDGDTDAAIAMIDKIQSPDTKAMTIRGIGMAVADRKLTPEQYKPIFQSLHKVATGIEHPPSHAIALTYIAMSQAFAGDDEGAWETAAAMDNDALRHKAFGETAEIQAERGDFESAMKSISHIDSESYMNKSLNTVTKILADGGLLENAMNAAMRITEPYKKDEALQYVLDKQKPRDVPHSKD